MNLCIPVLNGYDLLYKCIESALNGNLKPSMIYVVDNGNELPQRVRDIAGKKLFLYTPSSNLGVAASWNWFLKTVTHPMMITNHDIEFDHYDISRFGGAYFNSESEFFYTSNVSHLNMFSCFMPTKAVVDKVGLFDEQFFPAYFEDNDYFYRMQLAGIKLEALQTNITHYPSSTLERYTPEQKEAHHGQFRSNQSYYIAKWGGTPHKEVYRSPFNQ